MSSVSPISRKVCACRPPLLSRRAAVRNEKMKSQEEEAGKTKAAMFMDLALSKAEFENQNS
jgi:hypothetical protein